MRRRITDHAVAEELLQQFLERAQPRLAVDQRQQDDRERVLQRRELVQLVQHHFGIGVAFDVDHDPHRLLQIAQILDAGDALDLVAVDQFADPLHDPVAELLVGDLRDDDLEAAVGLLFDAGPGPDHDRAAAGVVALADPARPQITPPVGKSGPWTISSNSSIDTSGSSITRISASQTSRRLCGGIDVAMPTAIPPLPLTSRFGNRDGSTVGSRFRSSYVGTKSTVSRSRSSSIMRRDRRQAGFGVPHLGRRQAGDRAEVPLLVDQHVPHVPFLGHADQRGIDHRFAVRMVVTAGVAGDLGALDAARAGTRFRSFMATRMRRCEGFRPSRTSGSARLTITLIAYVR